MEGKAYSIIKKKKKKTHSGKESLRCTNITVNKLNMERDN